jgi:tRNA dimethylallyltransferase
MMTDRPSAFVLIGPTASGKSAVAQHLAEKTGAAIVSADSMNIYRGMDIGTAKPSPAERGTVNYHGIDLADPTDPFSVGDWLNAVRPVFQGLPALSDAEGGVDGEPPIVAGGTGLYVKCLLAGLDPMPAADEALRARAEKMTLAELQAEARAAAPEAYAALADNENPRRLVRLLEHGGLPRTQKKELPTIVGLHVEREELLKRITVRVGKMYAAGLIEEARGLIDLELSVTAQKAIGYAEAFAVLKNKMTEAQAKERTVIRTRQLAKRQMTWFRTQLNVEWVDTQKFQGLEELASEVSNVWKKVPVAI